MNTPGEKVLVIMPAYNEEASIGAVIDDVRRNAPQAGIIVVNDGSIDETESIASSKGVKVLTHPYNMGIGAAMQTGYIYALLNGYDVAVQVDSDGQHPADQIEILVRTLLENRADIVIGSRFLGGPGYRPTFARGIGITIFSRVVSAVLRTRLTDTTSGFRASGKRTIGFLSATYPEDYPEVESLVLLHKKGFSIMEAPVRMQRRSGGHSSISTADSVYYMIKVLLAIFVDLLKKV
ncbi:MAG: glycosyltransferase family 2 protein [Deltaproteobacteria bacterium]